MKTSTEVKAAQSELFTKASTGEISYKEANALSKILYRLAAVNAKEQALINKAFGPKACSPFFKESVATHVILSKNE